MRCSIMLEPQEGLSYGDILAVAQRAEAIGLEGCYRSDHYASASGREAVGSTDAWTTLAGLARETERIRLGTLVSPVTFRTVGSLVKSVATVAEMAGTVDGRSRVELGLGTGWMEREHRQYGFPLGHRGTRFRRLEEHLHVVRQFWSSDEQPFSFEGQFVTLHEAQLLPGLAAPPRLIVGGRGLERTPQLAARYADELNSPFVSPAEAGERREALDRACARTDRDPADVTYSVMTGCLVGVDEREFEARARDLHRASGAGTPFGVWLGEFAQAWVLGGPDRAAERLHELAQAGVERVMLQHRTPSDLDMIDVVGQEIAPRVAG